MEYLMVYSYESLVLRIVTGIYNYLLRINISCFKPFNFVQTNDNY